MATTTAFARSAPWSVSTRKRPPDAGRTAVAVTPSRSGGSILGEVRIEVRHYLVAQGVSVRIVAAIGQPREVEGQAGRRVEGEGIPACAPRLRRLRRFEHDVGATLRRGQALMARPA